MDPHQVPLLCLLVFLSIFSSSSSKCHPAERDALLRINSPIKRSLWNVSEDCCTWRNVECDETGKVITLNLDGNTKDNTLLPNSAIFDLRFLRTLTLGNYEGPRVIKSSIPKEISKLTKLRELVILGYGGSIPSSIGSLTKLQVLRLVAGRLKGNIPDSIGNLRQLTKLSLVGNKLSGTIPQSFGSLTNLVSIGLGTNELTGTLPSFLFDFPNLESLTANNNRFEGSIPRNIRPDSKLLDLSIENNKLTGIVPAWLFTRSLQRIWMQHNNFSGLVEPFRLPRVSSLTVINLSYNYLEGPLIPATPGLQSLDLSHNQFTGEIPMNYCGIIPFSVSFNKITVDSCDRFKKMCKSNYDLSLVC